MVSLHKRLKDTRSVASVCKGELFPGSQFLFFRLINLFGTGGYMGPEIQAMTIMAKEVVADYLDPIVARPGLTVQKVFLISRYSLNFCSKLII